MNNSEKMNNQSKNNLTLLESSNNSQVNSPIQMNSSPNKNK